MDGIKFPKIYLAIDNCFASKRWVKPSDWMLLIKQMGVNYIEASADNEIDPLYTKPEYTKRWIIEVKEQEAKHGMKVANLYSGHGTYTTTGLSHYDSEIKQHIQYNWLHKMTENATELNAGLGFFCHAFDQDVLNDPAKFEFTYNELIERLAELSVFADKQGVSSIGVEQMYTPHQPPWTIKGAKKLLEQVYAKSEKPFFITIDVGHQSGQHKFVKPDIQKIVQYIDEYLKNGDLSGKWLGPNSCYQRIQKEKITQSNKHKIAESILTEMEKYPYLFSNKEDSSPYEWISELGCYSPIIHLQQTDGKKSAHLPFTPENNSEGIIHGDKMLKTLMTAYLRSNPKTKIPKTDKIFFTVEVFASTAEMPYDIIQKSEKTVEYWREFIPHDGIELDKLVSSLNS